MGQIHITHTKLYPDSMGLFSLKTPGVDVTAEHCVIVCASPRPQQRGPGGTATNLMNVAALEEALHTAITDARAGEFDGNDFSGDDVYFYAYGPNADRLFHAIEPALQRSGARCRVMLRYGPAHDTQAPSRVIEIA